MQLDAAKTEACSNQQYLATSFAYLFFILIYLYFFFYLDFDAILTIEPCTMCAMALVHARFKRVFFFKLNNETGALISKWRLQDEPKINHHYEVFQLIEK